MDQLNVKIEGHVLMRDLDSGEIIVNRRNAIHRENMSFALASALSNTTGTSGFSGIIQSLAFGNGGVVVDGSGNITYNIVNVDSATDELYNQTYIKKVSFSVDEDSENNMVVVHESGTTFSDIVVTCTLDYGEPVGQDPLDDTANQEGEFVFDEIGLVSQQGRLLSHLIFHPVQKSENRKIQVVYTVRFLIG